MEMGPIVHAAAARRLGRPLTAAVTVKPPGWYQQQAIRSQFSGPFRALRPMVAELDRSQRDAGRKALANAGLPDFAILAVTESGLHVLRAVERTGRPLEEVTLLEPRSFGATSRASALLLELDLVLPNGRTATYEALRLSVGHANARGIEAVLALGLPAATSSPSPQPTSA